MKLKLGKMTTKELCKWFNISAPTYSRKKEKYLKELSYYCSFEAIFGGVIINSIITEQYIPPKEKIRTIINKEFNSLWDWQTGLDSFSNVKIKLKQKHPELWETYSDNTIYQLLLEYRNKNYGIPYKERGEIGTCSYHFRPSEKYNDGTRIYRNYTEAEKEIKAKIWNACFNDSVEMTELVKDLINQGILESSAAWDYYMEVLVKGKPGWEKYMELMRTYGITPTRATELMREPKV